MCWRGKLIKLRGGRLGEESCMVGNVVVMLRGREVESPGSYLGWGEEEPEKAYTTAWICTKSFWFLRPMDKLLSYSSG